MKRNILSANTWLFIELVIIAVVAWAVIDPAVVNLYYRLLPLGYDHERLLYAETVTDGRWTPDEEGEPQNPYDITEERKAQMLRQLEAVDGVESAYLFDDDFGAVGYAHTAATACKRDGDTLYVTAVNFTPDARFFETYGLRPLPGSPKAEELSRLKPMAGQVILTRSGAIALFGTADGVVGRRVSLCYQPEHEAAVAAVVEDFRKTVGTTERSLIIRPREMRSTSCSYVVRLKKGTDARRFVEEHGQELTRSGKTGFSRISRLMTFDDWLRRQELDEGRTQKVNQSLALALFFVANLMLAVVGTVWLHARRRTEECGVRRAFGATRLRLLSGFLWRGALLATVAVVVGSILYMNYVLGTRQEYGGEVTYEALYTTQYFGLPTDKAWPDFFWSHFLGVSAVVYILIMCGVLIGTAIPAMKIVGARITEALKDE